MHLKELHGFFALLSELLLLVFLSITGVPGLLVDSPSRRESRNGDLPAVATASKSKYPVSLPFSYCVTLMGGGRDLLSFEEKLYMKAAQPVATIPKRYCALRQH